MADVFTKKKRSEIMGKIKSTDTKLEVLFQKALTGAGLKHKKNVVALEGKPDIVFSKFKTAIFIDSCFWHGCRYHSHIPKSNKKYWINKIGRNKQRDRAVNKIYKTKGWTVVRVWEHKIKTDLEGVLTGISNKLKTI